MIDVDNLNGDDAEWRRLALQFDGHRMQAIGHLKAMLSGPQAHAAEASKFLAAGPLSGEEVLAQRIAEIAARRGPAFTVTIDQMRESHRTTYWVTLTNTALRPADAGLLDSTGRIMPFYSVNREHAVHTAKEWAEFLGVPAPEPCHCSMCSRPTKREK